MSKSNFIPINPDIYTKPLSPSGNRHLQKNASDPSFEAHLEQIRTRMDMDMARTLFDSEPATSKGSFDLFSQSLNLDVLATLTKLSSQRSLGASAFASARSPRGNTLTDPAPDMDTPLNHTDRQVDRLARKITGQGESVSSSSTPPRGSLSGRFESGEQCDAIGYDRHGGTSYGTYQISSRQGTMEQFIDFLREEIPAWAERLEQAGPANTGGTEGDMPSAWKAIAHEEPGLFADLQHRFITQSHYLPALDDILQSTGVGENLFEGPLQEVLFSTAVQHGPTGAGRIFKRALEAVDFDDPEKLTSQIMDQIYAIRKTQFVSSSDQVRTAVENRLTQEALLAKNLLDAAMT